MIRLAITSITLPPDTFVGHEFKVFGRELPAVVNGKWRVPVGEAATFRFCKFMWWHYWKLIDRCPIDTNDRPAPNRDEAAR
jgi:hypothetical protein